jgi:hypothetical protein
MAVRGLTEHPLGLTWVGDDSLERAAHALVHDGRVWLVDPFEDETALTRAAALGEIAGVLQLFVAHERDGRAIAQRLGAPFLPLPDQVPDAPFSVIRLDSVKVWKERALWWPERKGLVVAESIGTGKLYAVGRGPAGVHMIRRPLPPNTLKSFKPEHLLVGHGRPLHGSEAAAGLRDALDRSRRDIPTLIRRMPSLFRSMRGQS